jgi:hypothetical protein
MDLVNDWLSTQLDKHPQLSISFMLQELETPLFDFARWLMDTYDENEIQCESFGDWYYDIVMDCLEPRYYYLFNNNIYALSSSYTLYFVKSKTKYFKRKLIGRNVKPLWLK